MVKWYRRSAQKESQGRAAEQRRVLIAHERILERYRDEGAGAVVEDARRNAADALAVFDANDATLAAVLMVLGTICEEVGEVEEAEAADRQAREILLPLTDPDSRVQLATLLGTMAVREDSRLDLEAATTLREQALAVLREALPEVHNQVGTAVQNLAATWEARSEHDAADRVFAEHVAIAVEQGGDPDEVAALGPFPAALPVVLDHAAKRFEREGKLDAAEAFYRRAVASAGIRRGDDVRARAAASSNLATVIERRGRFEEAREIMLAALRELESAGGTDAERLDELSVQLMNNLGLLLYRAGDLGTALTLLEASLAARQSEGADARGIAESFTNLGLVRAAMGDLPGARDLMRAAYDAIEQVDAAPQAIDALNNLGWIARATGEPSEARRYYEEALRRRRLLYGERHPAVAESLNNLGVALLAAGELVAARTMLLEGLTIRRAIFGPQHPEVVASLVNVASALMIAGELGEAETHLLMAWTTHLMIDPDMRTPATSHILFALAQQAMLTGDWATAADALADALDHENLTTESVLNLGSERARLLRLALVRGHVDALISVAVDHSPDPQALAARAYGQVLRRKAMGLDFLALQRASMAAGVDKEGSKLASELALARRKLQRAVHQHEDADTLAEYRARVEELEADLARRTPWRTGPQEYQAVDVLKAVPAETTAVDYVRCGVWDPSGPFEAQWPRERYVAFVLPPGADRPRIVDLGDATAIDESIRAYRTEMLGREDAARGWDPGSAEVPRTHAGEEVRRLLVDPLGLRTHDARRLVIVPDGTLHLVSFAALPLPAGGQLIDEYELSMLTSARDLLEITRTGDSETSGPPIVLADPDFELADTAVTEGTAGMVGRLPTRGLPDESELRAAIGALPATATEGKAVGAVLGVQPITGPDADRERLLDVHGPVVLHLATHGFFLPTSIGVALGGATMIAGDGAAAGPLEDPLLRCGIVLAGANRWLRTREEHPRAGDGFVTGLDVLGMDLEGTQLVVLSACDTARGEILEGEGVLGLSRAFAGAGAESLVMSLWKVPDAETAELMTVFYRRLGDGVEIPTALRDAQLAIRAEHSHPVYWAAFIAQGRVRALTLPGRRTPGLPA